MTTVIRIYSVAGQLGLTKNYHEILDGKYQGYTDIPLDQAQSTLETCLNTLPDDWAHDDDIFYDGFPDYLNQVLALGLYLNQFYTTFSRIKDYLKGLQESLERLCPNNFKTPLYTPQEFQEVYGEYLGIDPKKEHYS